MPVTLSLPIRNQFTFKNLAHAIATVVGDAVKVGKELMHLADKAKGSEAVVEAITSVIDPALVPAERAAFALLGMALQAIHDAGPQAQNAGNVVLNLEQTMVTDLKAIYDFAMSELKKQGIAL